ncbi:EAL domain-containing protein [Leclercia adecarboxylata]|uniref:EAL domain-containing protein n=1 Tax=Leclercia adecarboxylata TaxID=83655 RepID=UPI0022E44153|nr:EAL domain-containing protein [Leclercia adecarboxylata]WJT04161.1 EAL domain-containing protein [Leclercia adecarboxylata]
MTTRHLVSVVTCVLVIAVLVPVCLSVWLAHSNAEDKFVEDLNSYASRVQIRTDRVITQAKSALNEMQSFKGIPCSREHTLMMRRTAFSWRYIQEMLYVDDLKPRCSSLEQESQTPSFPPALRITPDGYRAWVTSHNDLNVNRYMAAIGTGHYIVMIDPGSLIDVIPFGSWPIDVALVGIRRNIVFASSNSLDMQVFNEMQRTNSMHFQHNGAMYNVHNVPDLGFAIVTWASLKPLKESWHHQLYFWLPFGILISLLTAWFILRVLRRLQSPRHRLLDAINAREFQVHFQPIVALNSGRLTGAEALARWPQPDGSYLSPDIFVSLAEQTGLTNSLTTLIIEKVFEEMGEWLRQHPGHHISINLAPADLISGSILPLLSRLLNQWKLHPSQIALELTERGFADPTVSAPAIASFRRAGHAVYIDDFGTGYSSLSYLQDLDVDTLKIDKSFVDALEYKNVTSHIIEMARSLNLDMVAEGIETEGQLAWLRRHGVQYGQGWFFSKALPKEAFIQWADNNLDPESHN